jgi:hypothetical protein
MFLIFKAFRTRRQQEISKTKEIGVQFEALKGQIVREPQEHYDNDYRYSVRLVNFSVQLNKYRKSLQEIKKD